MLGYDVRVYRLAQTTSLEGVSDVPALLETFSTEIEQNKLLKSLARKNYKRWYSNWFEDIDLDSIRFCDEEMLDRFAKIQYMAEYLEKKRHEISGWNAERNVDASDLLNGRQLTNLGTFRAYVVAYLRNHPMIHQEMTFLVRHLAPTEHGLPIQIYVFSRDQVWSHYEGIQADIFDHILPIAPAFNLRIYQSPAESDVRTLLAALNTKPPC